MNYKWELLVETAIIIAIMAFFFYVLWLVMDLSKVCWYDFDKCPFKPWAESLLNSSLSSIQQTELNSYILVIPLYSRMSGEESKAKKRSASVIEVAAILVIIAMMLLAVTAIAIPLGVYLGILEPQVLTVFLKVFWIFAWVVAGFIAGYIIVEILA